MIPITMPGQGRLVLFALLAVLLLSACADSTTVPTTPPKPVKVEVVGQTVQSRADSFVGTLRARQRAALGFESPGRVVAIGVDVGDSVRAGQLLARLDESPARWHLDRAVAERSAAAATLDERRHHLRQHETLARNQVISASALQAVQTAHQQAVSQLEAAEAAVEEARRDLELMRITAPFDGVVAARNVEPYSDVAAGQPILLVESEGELEVVVMLPDRVAAMLAPGMQAQANSDGDRLALTLERLSSRSDRGSLVQAIFRVDQFPEHVRSGGAVSIELASQVNQAVTLPITAIMPGTEVGKASVFLIDAQGGTLQRRTVRTERSLQPDGRVVIAEGLREGEQVVVAGTAFLHEGQSVIVHEAQTLLTGVHQ
ncbi:efflux RND transporter periplasmic adaptor subunit [Halomonas sp. JS92-SW72]|uniref:efflux RND transporter periplasmic adaptor subunit n=1 Tax=Halomonas sp. JS92-SW72 TaxID=2306583 RepID=UPI0019697071|nr:efflux RND transporter periplasmic adaptor subunit [Halomonas sp. JS92-SW72]